MNRKNAYQCLKNGKKLRNSSIHNHKKYFISENLCPEILRILNKLYKLKKNGEIFNLWTPNGVIFMKMGEREENIPVEHVDNFNYYIDERSNRFSDNDKPG